MQNLHPLTVHLPLALLTLAAAAELAYAVRRRPLLDVLSRWFLYLGTIGAAFAALSGWLGAESVAPVRAAADEIVRHRNLGFLTLGAASALALWRWASSRAGGPRPRPVFSIAVVALAGLLFYTGWEGGELVYEHGVGTRLTAPGGPLHSPPDSADAAPRRDVPQSRDFR